jgi:hypothetical protein
MISGFFRTTTANAPRIKEIEMVNLDPVMKAGEKAASTAMEALRMDVDGVGAWIDHALGNKTFDVVREHLESWLSATLSTLPTYSDASKLFMDYLGEQLQAEVTSTASGKGPGVSRMRMRVALYFVRERRLALAICELLDRKNIRVASQDIWKLVIDARCHTVGPWAFESESGYLLGMLSGFEFMLASLEQPLSAKLFEDMHDHAVTGVRSMYRTEFRKGIRDGGPEVVFNVRIPENATMKGLEEFKARYSDTNPARIVPKLEADTRGRDAGIVVGAYGSKAALHTAAERIISEHLTMAGSGDKAVVLKSIAECLSRLEQYHFFDDGNARTVGVLVLNMLLLQQGFGMCILENPNRLDMYSVDEIVEEIERGLKCARLALGADYAEGFMRPTP